MQKLYFRAYELNIIKGINELYKLVDEKGGRVVSEYTSEKHPIAVHDMKSGEYVMDSYFVYSIQFVLGEKLYYVSFNENPYFADHYLKYPCRNLKALRQYRMGDLEKIYLDYVMTDEEIKDSMRKLFDFLMKAPESQHYDNYTTIRVPNQYNDGFHNEKVIHPEGWDHFKEVRFMED